MYDVAGASDAALRKAKRLQLIDCFADIFHRYICGNACGTDARYHNEADFSAFKFFVELYCIENFLTRKICRQPSGQSEFSKEIDNRGALVRR